MSRRGGALARIALVFAVAAFGFAVAQAPSRRAETHAAVSLLRLVGAENVFVASSTSIGVVPRHRPAFQAVVTPACSSVSSVLAVVGLAWLAPRRGPLRRWGSVSAAVSTIALGNVVRIAASVAVGLVAGRASLVLFHDWVGSVFGFAYTLAGYVVLLYLLLPRTSRRPERLSWESSRSVPVPSVSAFSSPPPSGA